MTLVEMLEKNARDVPEKTAIIFHEDRMNYREFDDAVNKAANFFIDTGIKKGDRIGIMLPRIPELVVGFLAVAKAHGVAVPINFELTHEKIRAILEDTSPQYLIVHASFLDLVRKSIPTTVHPLIVVVGKGGESCAHWEDILISGKAKAPGLDINESDVVYLNYTSGATGNSKGAVTTHANIYWNTLASVKVFGLTSEDIHLCMFAPFAHPHEIFARPLHLGGTMVFMDKIYPKSLAETISHHRVTCMMGLAPMYENLLAVLEHKDYDLSSLRIPESGGMYTRHELIEKFREKVGVSIVPVWGSTETTGIALANQPGEHIPLGSVGKPCFSYEVKIVDENGAEVPVGVVGEMMFKGPAVVGGYYKNTAGSQMSFEEGWYYSGDLGRTDEYGNFYFIGRKSGMMKVAGLKVYPLEVEIVLMSHPDIKEAAVVAAKDRLRGEVPRAIIVSEHGKKLKMEDVLKFCKGKLAQYKIPKIIGIRNSLPKIGSGKVNKKVLQMENV